MIAGPLELAKDRDKTLWAFRVAGRDVMLEHPRIREESDDHGSSSGTIDSGDVLVRSFVFPESYQMACSKGQPAWRRGRCRLRFHVKPE
jgi:hypothetical protein